MKNITSRFASPTVLTDDTEILGATAKEWHKALTGNFQKSLDIVKARARNIDLQKRVDFKDAPLDLASSIQRDRVR